MAGLPLPIDPTVAPTSAPPSEVRVETETPRPRPRLRLQRGSADDPAPLLDLDTGSVLRTILTAARRHAAEAGAASEIRDISNALERAVALLEPVLRQALLRSLQDNFGLATAGEGVPGHVWRPTNYGALCEGCGFSVAGSEPRLMHALSDTHCTGRYDDTASLLQRSGTSG